MNILPDLRHGLVKTYNTRNNLLKPTTYANSGSAIYTEPDSDKMFAGIVSPTAFTNLLEETMIEGNQLVGGLSDVLPHLKVTKYSDDYPVETFTSLEIPHRIASSWFMNESHLIDSEGKKEKKKTAFQDIFISKVKEVGMAPTVAYYCPNSLLHGYMFTMLKSVNPNYSKSTGLISGCVNAYNITKVKNSGVSFDPITTTSNGLAINGEKNSKKLSTKAIGNIVIGDSVLVKSNDVRLDIEILYRRIKKLPVAAEVKELIADLANLQVGLLLNNEIDVRVNTVLHPEDEIYGTYDEDELISKVKSSLSKCKDQGLINPEVTTNFEVSVTSK